MDRKGGSAPKKTKTVPSVNKAMAQEEQSSENDDEDANEEDEAPQEDDVDVENGIAEAKEEEEEDRETADDSNRYFDNPAAIAERRAAAANRKESRERREMVEAEILDTDDPFERAIKQMRYRKFTPYYSDEPLVAPVDLRPGTYKVRNCGYLAASRRGTTAPRAAAPAPPLPQRKREKFDSGLGDEELVVVGGEEDCWSDTEDAEAEAARLRANRNKRCLYKPKNGSYKWRRVTPTSNITPPRYNKPPNTTPNNTTTNNTNGNTNTTSEYSSSQSSNNNSSSTSNSNSSSSSDLLETVAEEGKAAGAAGSREQRPLPSPYSMYMRHGIQMLPIPVIMKNYLNFYRDF